MTGSTLNSFERLSICFGANKRQAAIGGHDLDGRHSHAEGMEFNEAVEVATQVVNRMVEAGVKLTPWQWDELVKKAADFLMTPLAEIKEERLHSAR